MQEIDKNQVGFVLPDLTSGQVQYTLIQGINTYLKTHFSQNISVFLENNGGVPCDWPEFASFSLRDTMTFYGSLVCTSFDMLKKVESATRSKKYWYIQDLEWTRGWFKHDKRDVETALNNGNVIKIFRSEDYLLQAARDFCVKYIGNWEVSENSNIEKIMEIINGTKK